MLIVYRFLLHFLRSMVQTIDYVNLLSNLLGLQPEQVNDNV